MTLPIPPPVPRRPRGFTWMRCWNFRGNGTANVLSRSMASAFTILCDRLGPGCEAEIAKAMRRRAPHAQPNRLLVRHADEALGRGGAMLAAVAAMGLPVVVEEG